MAAVKPIAYGADESARREICDFINEGLEDVRNRYLLSLDEVFCELGGRYTDEVV